MSQHKRYTRSEEVALFKAGNGNQVVEAHLGLVYGIAKKYSKRGQMYDDFVQQGCVGLMRAAAKFDPDRGFRFITYATPWVHVEIRIYARSVHRLVRLPTTKMFDKALSANRAMKIHSVEDLLTIAGMDLANAETLWPILMAPDASYEVFHEDGESSERARSEDNPETTIATREAVEAVRAAIEALNEHERTIVVGRMGEEPRSLRELGDVIGCSHGHVRTIEMQAHEKLAAMLSDAA